MNKLVATLTAAIVVATSAAANAAGRTCFDKHTGETYREGGVYEQHASWYGQELAGNPTASGITFDPSNPTILAHKVLPLGTVVSVYNPETGIARIATILDDGPHVEGRQLDASEALATALGFRGQGQENLVMTVISMSDDECRDDNEGLR